MQIRRFTLSCCHYSHNTIIITLLTRGKCDTDDASACRSCLTGTPGKVTITMTSWAAFGCSEKARKREQERKTARAQESMGGRMHVSTHVQACLHIRKQCHVTANRQVHVSDIVEGLQELRVDNPEEEEIDTWLELQGQSLFVPEHARVSSFRGPDSECFFPCWDGTQSEACIHNTHTQHTCRTHLWLELSRKSLFIINSLDALGHTLLHSA